MAKEIVTYTFHGLELQDVALDKSPKPA